MAGTQDTTTAAEKRGSVRTASMAALISILTVLLVFPGFFAGVLSRTDVVCLANEEFWFVTPTNGVRSQVMVAVLLPSERMMHASPTIRKFYIWQFRLVKGREAEVDF